MNLIEKIFRKKVIRYEQVGAKSLIEGMSMNGFSIRKDNDATAERHIVQDEPMNEVVDFEFENKGGIIVFSPDVNAVQLSDNRLANWILQKIKTFKQRMGVDNKLASIAKKHESVYAYTIGNFVKGQYKADNGKIFTEASKSMEIIGIESADLIKIAEDICREFAQESVLVKDYQANKIFIVKK